MITDYIKLKICHQCFPQTNSKRQAKTLLIYSVLKYAVWNLVVNQASRDNFYLIYYFLEFDILVKSFNTPPSKPEIIVDLSNANHKMTTSLKILMWSQSQFTFLV